MDALRRRCGFTRNRPVGPHVAFVVDDLAQALAGKEILISPNSPSEGVTVAMILSDGVPVELLEFG